MRGPEKTRVRPLRREDLPEVRQIDAESLERPWSEGVWREELRSPFGTYLVAEGPEGVAGYIGIKHTAGELHIVTIAVRAEYRRRGIARTLIEAAISEYASASRVYLEVRPSNVAARALYESFGFRETGRRPRYYGNEDALLMTLDLHPEDGLRPEDDLP
ncbi:MAG: ribosomal protein S18-alanine N-acetyltransferase [Rubrobacter sp.]|nr:ribosomal protein S18-alanine N-acetyltransferase [Rubrobacter sp.]